MTMLPVGSLAPDIHARNADGAITLSQLRGRYVLVYFYPKDDTPGCVAEARALNDALDDLEGCGADVIGVSTQGESSHDKFRAKYGLRFALASDADRSIADAYGVGKALGFLPLAARQSFLVDPNGKIAHTWPRILNPGNHAAEVLSVVQELSAATAT
jgi:thioredoxin-dependent peroxiredoxin